MTSYADEQMRRQYEREHPNNLKKMFNCEPSPKCKNCRTSLNVSWKHCANCGTKLD